MLHRQGSGFLDDIAGPTEQQLGSKPFLDCAEAALLEPHGAPSGEVELRELGQRLTAPQRVGSSERLDRARDVAGGEEVTALRGASFEAARIDLIVRDMEAISDPVALQWSIL